MKALRVVNFDYPVYEDISYYENTTEFFAAYLGNKTNVYGRITLTLIQYLLQYSEIFSGASVVIADYQSRFLWNSTWAGKIERNKVPFFEIAPQASPMYDWDEDEEWSFAYPYGLSDYTFLTRKQKYKPHVFGIFGAFSSSLWTATFSVFVVTSLVYYVSTRHPFHEVLLQGLAVLLRKGSILRPSSFAENLVLWSWVAGTMFLCLAYDSVFLSFLTVPPLTEIKNVRQLAAVVQEGEYHCVAMPSAYDAFVEVYLMGSGVKNLVVIGRDLLHNYARREDLIHDFFQGKSSSGHVAFVSDTETIQMYATREMSTSVDRFLQIMSAMTFRKSFCCPELLDVFVRRLMSSGLYFKYQSDERHFLRLSYLLKGTETDDSSERSITLTDVGAAFLFLLAGYTLATLVLVGEIWQHRRKKTRRHTRKRVTDGPSV